MTRLNVTEVINVSHYVRKILVFLKDFAKQIIFSFNTPVQIWPYTMSDRKPNGKNVLQHKADDSMP